MKFDELPSWDVPDVVKNGIPYGLTGYDREGSIVIVIPFKGTDAYGLFHASSKQEVIKYIIKVADGKKCALSTLKIFQLGSFQNS